MQCNAHMYIHYMYYMPHYVIRDVHRDTCLLNFHSIPADMTVLINNATYKSDINCYYL